MALSENVVYRIVPNGFADHYPYEKWLFHWEYTLFSDKLTLKIGAVKLIEDVSRFSDHSNHEAKSDRIGGQFCTRPYETSMFHGINLNELSANVSTIQPFSGE